MTRTDPASWPASELEAVLASGHAYIDPSPSAGEGAHGMVVGSTGVLAQRAGVKALQAGGTAVDAALTTALAQIALSAGAWVSYTGLLGMVTYDAKTGRTRSLSAPFRTCTRETDALTIPRDGTPSGRTTMVPGFMSGVQAAHDAHGALPWADLFAPAIWVAEHGFELAPGRERQIQMRTDVLGRWPQTREIFQRSDGSWLDVGDTLQQRELATTLRAVASEGASYMTEGPWARKLVEALRELGGRITLDDLASYEPIWSEPLMGSFRGFELAAIPAPQTGGAMLVEGLHLIEESDLRSMDDVDALFWLIQIMRQTHVLTGTPPDVRATRSHASDLWTRMRERGAFVGPGSLKAGTHSDYVVAADADGNVAALCHTSNVSLWGLTGLFVDGIHVPDAARFQPEVVDMVGPGGYMPNPLNPGIALRDGRPVLGWSCIGAGLVETTLQCVASVLDRGDDVRDAVGRPMVLGPAPEPESEIVGGAAPPEQVIPDTDMDDEDADPLGIWRNYLRRMPQGVPTGAFPTDVLDAVRARGLALTELDPADPAAVRGLWGGIEIATDGAKRGGRTGGLNGAVDCY